MKISKKNLLVLAILTSSMAFGATYGGGTGEPNNPYQIWTPGQMNTIGANSGDWYKCFKLMADIDMAGRQYKIIKTFGGKFDGNNHIIRNLTYNSSESSYVGLFG